MTCEALIVAGGHASRLDSTGVPKSLRTLDGTPLVSLLLDNLGAAGVTRIAVTTNRRAFGPHLHDVCGSRATVLWDEGGPSTIDAARTHAHLMSDSFLFCYGHVVSPVWLLKEAMAHTGEFATGVAISSRRDPIPCGVWYLEPPFWLDRERLRRSPASSWSAHWGARAPARVGCGAGPGESNTTAEFERYLTWLRASRGH